MNSAMPGPLRCDSEDRENRERMLFVMLWRDSGHGNAIAESLKFQHSMLLEARQWIARNDDGRYTVLNPPPDLERGRKRR